jgi:hypothetical protein
MRNVSLVDAGCIDRECAAVEIDEGCIDGVNGASLIDVVVIDRNRRRLSVDARCIVDDRPPLFRMCGLNDRNAAASCVDGDDDRNDVPDLALDFEVR